MISRSITRRAGVLIGASLFAVFAAAPAAYADYLFTGSGSSGNFVGQAAEPWADNYDFGIVPPTGVQPDWGSPGVSAGLTPYLEAQSAYGLELTFNGAAAIDSASITIGNSAGCAGTTTGGTTFCTISPTDIWQAIQTGPDSIAFLAQNPSFFLSQGQDYFVNVFFQSCAATVACPGAPTSFSGVWLTEFTPSVPEPMTLSLFGAGLAGAVALRRRKKALA